jgi:aromatic-L-amino-acid decarboxylase
MRTDALATAIDHDRAAGHRPIAIVATLGTTNTSSVDPVAEIADVAEREGLWLHVDAAYGGSAALVPDLRPILAGWERATSIVVNPHKWMAVPFDASLLLTTRLDSLRTAFSHVPEYLRPTDAASGTRNVSEYTPQLGRRFRALKVWVMLRAFGLAGMRRRIGWHVELARDLAARIEADPDWEVVAPVPFSTLCVRWHPAATSLADAEEQERLDAANQAIIESVNATGEVLLSHTRLDGRFIIRIALGHIRAERRHVDRVWELLQTAAAEQALALGQGMAIGGKSAP